MFFLMGWVLASGSAGAAGLIHLPLMLLPSFVIGFVCSRYILKTEDIGVTLILSGLSYVVVFYTRFEIYFPVMALLGL